MPARHMVPAVCRFSSFATFVCLITGLSLGFILICSDWVRLPLCPQSSSASSSEAPQFSRKDPCRSTSFSRTTKSQVLPRVLTALSFSALSVLTGTLVTRTGPGVYVKLMFAAEADGWGARKALHSHQAAELAAGDADQARADLLASPAIAVERTVVTSTSSNREASLHLTADKSGIEKSRDAAEDADEDVPIRPELEDGQDQSPEDTARKRKARLAAEADEDQTRDAAEQKKKGGIEQIREGSRSGSSVVAGAKQGLQQLANMGGVNTNKKSTSLATLAENLAKDMLDADPESHERGLHSFFQTIFAFSPASGSRVFFHPKHSGIPWECRSSMPSFFLLISTYHLQMLLHVEASKVPIQREALGCLNCPASEDSILFEPSKAACRLLPHPFWSFGSCHPFAQRALHELVEDANISRQPLPSTDPLHAKTRRCSRPRRQDVGDGGGCFALHGLCVGSFMSCRP